MGVSLVSVHCWSLAGLEFLSLMAHTKYEAAAAPPVLWLTSVASPGMEAVSHLTGADGAVTALHTAG